jgi:hypothetical protein
MSLATAAAAAAGALTGPVAGSAATAPVLPNTLKADAYIVQRYIDRPYLIGGKKCIPRWCFDLI